MGYRVYYGDYLLYDPVMTDYKLIKPKLSLELTKVGSFTFTIPKTHPNFAFIEIMKPMIRVYLDGILKFKGRIYKMKEDFYGNVECKCEDCLGFLTDILIAPFSSHSTSVSQLIVDFLNEHNSKASASQQVQIGTIDGSDITVTRWGETYKNTLESIKTHVISHHGGYIILTYDQYENPVINYKITINAVNTQHAVYGQNLANHIIDRDADDFATVVVPLGMQMNEIYPEGVDENGNKVGAERITIESVYGSDHIVNDELANVYGMIYQYPSKTTHDSIKNPETLFERGKQDLIEAIKYKKTVTVTMADLGFLDRANYATPDIGYNVVIDSIPHYGSETGSVTYLLRALDVDLSDPAMTELTLGDEKQTFLAKQTAQLEEVANKVSYIEANYITEAQTIAQTTIENNTSIIQEAEQIILTALRNYVTSDEFVSKVGELSTSLSVTAEGVSVNTTSIEELTTQLEEGAVATYVNAINSYVRVLNGNVILGNSNSEIKLKLQNNVLYFYSGDDTAQFNPNTAIAYFSNNRLYVKNISAVNTLNIGNFYWQPEANDSLSLIYNG